MMSQLNFVLPINTEELLTSSPDQYYVREVLSASRVSKELKVASAGYNEAGSTYILNHFDTYFSAVHLYQDLPRVVIYGAFEDIKKSLLALPNALNFYIQQDESPPEEVKQEVQNILKMTIYLYVSLFNCLEKAITSDSILHNNRKKSKDAPGSNLKVNWASVISALKKLFQVPLNNFWDSAGVDNALINKLLELTMSMLKDQRIKQDKEAASEIWSFFGLLVSNYGVANALVIRVARLVKEHEFLAPIVADGVQHLVELFETQALLVTFVYELTEWQLQEANVESNAVKNSTRVVHEFAMRLPEQMRELLEYLSKYLRADSPQLRAMVLGVQVEILVAESRKVATMSADDKEPWRLLRNEILTALEAFTQDSSSFVRARVFGFIARLMRENIVPAVIQQSYLKKSVLHMRDVTSNVRKAAANCITCMLKHNTFGPKLPYKQLSEECTEKKNELVKFKYDVFGIDMEKQEQIEREWTEHLPGLLAELQQLEINPEDESDEENGSCHTLASGVSAGSKDSGISDDCAPMSSENERPSIDQLIRDAIVAKEYKIAVEHCQTASKTSAVMLTLRDRINEFTDVQFYLCYMQLIYSKISLNSVVQPTQEEHEKLSEMQKTVDYLTEVVKFLETMREAMALMCELLTSVTIGDMHEAVDFIIAARQFELDDAADGINALLKIMLRNEEDRRNVAGAALQTVFLTTDATNLLSHTTQVMENLIMLYRTVSTSSFDALSTLVTMWATQGTLSNDIIDALWSAFLQKTPTTKENSRIALCILRLATAGRHTIIDRNYRIVATICFEKCGFEDPLLVVEGLEMLQMLGTVGIVGDEPAFRLLGTDPIWGQIVFIIKHYQHKKTPVVNNILAAAVRLIFAIHSKPFPCVETLLKWFTPRSQKTPIHKLITYCVLVGEIAVSMHKYLDTDVYNELKRRQNVRLKKSGKVKDVRASAALNNSSALKQRNATALSTTGNLDESVIDGAEAADEDADFITHVLEHSLDKQISLSRMFEVVLLICRKPSEYPTEVLQVAGASALARGMLLSSVFCEKYVLLLFTMLLRSPYVQVKVTILIHLVDLLDRFPNLIDPYTTKLYILLQDKTTEVRQTALNTLSLLILKDMIRPQGHIWQLAVCLVDDDAYICKMARSFFLQSSEKSNNLYNYMPDIFTSLSEKFPRENTDDADVNEEKFQIILKYLFTLIDKSKQIEVLVERFCLKFDNANDALAKRIAFVLALMPYNERALQKLIENFPKFKHFILADEVYSWIKVICTNAKSKELKVLATQLEELVKEMFKVDGNPPRNIFRKPAPAKKKKQPVKNAGRRKLKRRNTLQDSGSDSDE